MSASRPLPANLDAERAVLGSLLLDRDAIAAVADWLKPEHFYLEKHRWVYEAALSCYQRVVPPDLNTVGDALRVQGRLPAVGDTAGLTELTDGVIALHVEYYARIVQKCGVLRRVIQAGGAIAALGYGEDRALDDVLGDVNRMAIEVTQASDSDEDMSIAAAAHELTRIWDGGETAGTLTGLSPLDDKLGGLRPGNLIILAARPGVGKSALACWLMLSIAKHGSVVQTFSLEMSRKENMQRFVSIKTGADLGRVVRHEWGDQEFVRWVDAAGQVASLPITLDDRSGITFQTLRARALRHAAKHGRPALVIVDYLQLVRGDANYGKQREAEVASVSRGLKQLAKELDAPLLALAQLNRALEHRTDKLPTLADLRESGQIEADADVVMFIHRPSMYEQNPKQKYLTELHIAKNRMGPTGIVSVEYQPQNGQWGATDHYHEGAGYEH